MHDSPVDDRTTTSRELRVGAESGGPSDETTPVEASAEASVESAVGTPCDAPGDGTGGWPARTGEGGARSLETPSRPSGLAPDELADPRARVRMHPLTLRFDQPLEAEFAVEYFRRTLSHLRIALVLAFLLYAIFGVLDTWIAPNEYRQLWIIRYCIVCPLLLACLLATYERGFRRVREAAITFVVLVAALGIAAMTAIIPSPGSYLYYAGLLLVIAWASTLVRLTLPYTTAATGAIMVAYFIVATLWNRTSAQLVVNNMFFLTSAVIIGFWANYTMERYARTNFLQRRLIDRRTRELEEINTELVVKNRMLAESRAATIHAERRSEQIFSALADALPGTVLDGKYRIAEKIGSGGFGTVYRGEHIFLHHPVAIKVFRPTVGHGSLESLDRFRREGISACRINHPNAVSVLDFDVSAGSLAYLVMELLRGHSLSDELRTAHTLPPRRVVQIATAVYDALAAAHAVGIVHRDIKPSNVFLHQGREEEQVKVIDFGIAKLMDGEGAELAKVTMAGTLVGTPAYMAPERLLSLEYDGRADVYSAGVMMYEMLSGRLPFETRKGEYWSVARMHLVESPPPLGSVARGVPAELETLVDRTMIKEPEDRPTAAEVATALRALSRAGRTGAQG